MLRWLWWLVEKIEAPLPEGPARSQLPIDEG